MNLRGLFVALLLSGSTLAAQTEQERLRLDDLVAEALQHNPEINAAKNRYEAARQRPLREGSLPDLVLSPGFSSNGSPRPFAGVGIWQTSHAGFMVSQDFPFPGKRKLRGEIATKEAEAEFQQYELVRLRVMAHLKRAYHQLRYAYAAIDVLTRSRELLGKFERVTRAPYITIRGAQEAQLAFLEARILKMEQEKRSQEAEINSLLNRELDTPLARPADVEPPKLPWAVDELLAGTPSNGPLLRREGKVVERAQLAVSLARKEYHPDYTISVGYFNMGQMPGLYQVRVDLKLPVYFWRKQRPALAEQVYNLHQARRSYEAANRTLQLHIKNEYLKAETASRLANIYARDVIPKASTAVESSLATYEAGAADIMAVLSNFTALVEYELSYHEETLNFCLALIRLEELTGRSLVH